MPLENPPTLFALPSLRFLEVSGADAEAFLNAQLSRNVAGRGSDRAPLSAWHDSKGRVRALLRALRNAERWLVMAHGSDPHALIRNLTVFVLRADVQLRDVSAHWHGGAVLGDLDAWLAARGAELGEASGDVLSGDGAFLVRVSRQMAYLAGEKTRATLASELPAADGPQGELAEIRAGLLDLSPELADRFSPHMLNLDRLGVLAFDKGCYPGQEVIARVQHLGNLKRRLFRFSAPLGEPPGVGSPLTDPSGVEVGEILRVARAGARRVEFLAVVRIDAVNEPLAFAGAPQVPIRKEPLPGEP
ncbi:MAG: hypothetical protein OXF98_13045 [Rhodospirillaceae bacterium]|nr:hypothetical protein [Rhodospirillaceae bacterium]